MNSYDFDIGILGGGAAGLTIAAGASQLGAKTTKVEFGSAAFVDDHAVAVGGKTWSARNWFIATGSSPVHPYPTLAEINKRVAGTFLSTKLFSEKVRKALAFFFHLKGRACE